MTVLVTGASGHVGANLIRFLLAQGRSVRALLHADRRAIKGLEVETVECDICNPDSLRAAFDGIEVVYHLAANISLMRGGWQQIEAINVAGTRNVVEACLKSGVKRLIHLSSIHALAIQDSNIDVIDESCSLVDSPDCPPYDRSKASGEREVYKGIELGLNAIIIIPTAIIGPHDYKPSHFGKVLLALANGQLLGLVSGGFDWVDVRDVVEGATQAEKKASIGARYILSGHWISLTEVAHSVAEITGMKAPSIVLPLWLAQIGAPLVTGFDLMLSRRPLFTSVSIRALHANHNISHEKATREISYHPRPFRETIMDTLQWFQDIGLLTHSAKVQSKDQI